MLVFMSRYTFRWRAHLIHPVKGDGTAGRLPDGEAVARPAEEMPLEEERHALTSSIRHVRHLGGPSETRKRLFLEFSCAMDIYRDIFKFTMYG